MLYDGHVKLTRVANDIATLLFVAWLTGYTGKFFYEQRDGSRCHLSSGSVSFGFMFRSVLWRLGNLLIFKDRPSPWPHQNCHAYQKSSRVSLMAEWQMHITS